MQSKMMLDNLNSFMKKIKDKESEQLFDARLQYLFYRDRKKFYKSLDEILQNRNDSYDCLRLQQYERLNPQNKEKNIVIFGAGERGQLTCRSLMYLKRKVHCFIDNNADLWGSDYKGSPIYGLAEAQENLRDCVVVVSVDRRWQLEIYHQLIHAGIKESDILMPQEGYLFSGRGNQYFDLEEVKPDSEGEYFVDAGAYDGVTSLECANWCKGKLKKIYAFEPDHNNYLQCNKVLNQSGYDYELYECATWDDETTLHFWSLENEGYASAVHEKGKISIKADSIDHKLAGRKATYIKYDVEGSEMKALKGSIKTIQKYRPKLAISIYHKPEDIMEIPVFLEELGLDYHYYLRQYQVRMEETILYAI